uniref:Uncharacterized protein n=1 Tax=Grammatophora oceanica TaxID=210454 RepID=A0A7S1YHY4_9STRA
MVKELLPLLKKGAELRGEARIVHQSSMARRGAGTSASSPGLEASYFEKKGGDLGGDSPGWMGPMSQRYSQSKLANSVFTMALKEKLEGTNVKAVVAAPGVTSTGMLDSAMKSVHRVSFSDSIVSFLLGRVAQSAEDGSMPLLAACFDPSTESGDFWEPENCNNCFGPAVKVKKVDEKSINPDNSKLLWAKSEEAVGRIEI